MSDKKVEIAGQQPLVAVLLCTLHGQMYLEEQLDSIAAQTYTNWVVWASDDGSEDETHQILQYYLQLWGPNKISIHNGPAEGFAANFLSLSCKASVEADYFAYSDQDDIWRKDKLEKAVEQLNKINVNTPALYCSRTQLVDANNQHIGYSALFTRPPSFRNALLQSIGGGNTLVYNRAARELIKEAGQEINIITHDWWVYILVAGAGGYVYYDSYPSVRYRQHAKNVVGENISLRAKLQRVRLLVGGHFKDAIDKNITALQKMKQRLTVENQQILEDFITLRKLPACSRVKAMQKLGLYRQTGLGNLGILVAAFFNKI